MSVPQSGKVLFTAIAWPTGTNVPNAPIAQGLGTPLLTDTSTGRLLVDIGSSVTIDTINADFTTTNGLLTSAVSDLNAISTNTATNYGSFTTIPAFTSKTFSYTSGNLTTIAYFNGSTQVAHRTLGYSSGNLVSDTLSIP